MVDYYSQWSVMATDEEDLNELLMVLSNATRRKILAKLVAQEAQQAGVTISMQLDDKLPLIVVDDIQIQQVLLNLLRNAIEAMSETEPGQRALIVRTSLAQDDHVEITITDTGPGIPQDKIEQLFQPFETTKSEGLGMGLPISRSIIEAHGGQMGVQSEPGQGTCFFFHLPVGAEGPQWRAASHET